MVRVLGIRCWDGFANAGDTAPGDMGEPDGRLVLRSPSGRVLQYLSSVRLAVSALPAVHHLPGECY